MADSDPDEKPSMLPDQYTIGWISALSEELGAARAMLDEEHEGLEDQPSNDDNSYVLGSIRRHNIVMPILPDYGISSATSAVKSMQSTFPNLRFILMVGIGGGIPSHRNDIRLGDVVVSEPSGQGGGVIQYDLGREENHQFDRVGLMNRPPKQLLATIRKLRSENGLGATISKLIEKAAKKREDEERWIYPGADEDILFAASSPHLGENDDHCKLCSMEPNSQVPRDPRKFTHPKIHYGNIGSGNKVMKNATERDEIANSENIICFEMEAAGLMNECPCLVIRGISDYADSHKNWKWQPYAALAAAAYAKRMLREIPPRTIDDLKPLREVLQGALQDINTQMTETSRTVNKIVSAQEYGHEDTMLQWLTTVDHAPQHNDFINRRQHGTGEWFLELDEFKVWEKTGKQTLFCPGIPGAGKTIITAVVIHHLQSKFQGDPNTGIAYIYCNFKLQDEHDPENLLASLLKQLARSRPTSVRNLYNRHQKDRTRPTLEEIYHTLKSVATSYSRVFIVIDALDEYRTTYNSRTRFLEQIFQLQDDAEVRVNIFATSRPSEEISSSFAKCVSCTISATEGDIQTYLNSRILLEKSSIIDDETRDAVVKGVLDAAEGMFLLVQLHADTLLSKLTKGDLKQALNALGKGMAGLDDTYDLAMKRIEGQGEDRRDLAKKILTWIIHSRRPLSILELQHALAVHEMTEMLNPDFLPSRKIMLSLCAGLLTVDEGRRVIRLVHYTMQEYFDKRRQQLFPDAETDIIKVCATYLSFSVFGAGLCATENEFEERLESNPLYLYAASQLGHHARHASTVSLHVVMGFLEREANLEAASQAEEFQAMEGYVRRIRTFARRTTGLHWAAQFGIEEMVKLLLQKKVSVDVKTADGRTPLLYATRNRHKDVVKLLLEKDADPNATDSSRQTPLWEAVSNGDRAIVELLLEKGADLSAIDSRGQTPLLNAVVNRDKDIVKLLLEEGADPNTTNSIGQTPLWYAVVNKDEGIVKLLLEKGADPNTTNSIGQAPLWDAVLNKDEDIIELLLEKGADPNATNSRGLTPLWFAVTEGDKAIVKLLLKN